MIEKRIAYESDGAEIAVDAYMPEGGGARPALQQAGPDEPPPEVTGLDTVSSVRVVFLAGQRNVRFQRRRSLDAVRGVEDVRLGGEAEVALGRSLAGFSDDDDLRVDAGLSFAGAPVRSVVAGVRAMASGRRDYGARTGQAEWRSIFAQVDGWAYWRASPQSRHTVVGAASLAGGWRTTVPFQLTLGSRAGVRGLPTHAYAGERRVVATLEHRAYLGWPYPRLFDLGTATFVDVGKMWAGGDVFGMESPWAASVGAGLRLAFPPGSRRTYRLDVAVPLAAGYSPRDVVFTVGVGQAVGRTRDDDPQIRRSNRRALSASLFSFPN